MKNSKSSRSDQQNDFLRDEFRLLQGSREALIDLNDRQVNFFLAMVSGAAILLTFISQQQGKVFQNLAIVAILFTIFLLGLLTFARTVEVDIGIATYSRGLNRIRRYFVENNTEIARYLILPTNDNLPSFTAIRIVQGIFCKLDQVLPRKFILRLS